VLVKKKQSFCRGSYCECIRVVGRCQSADLARVLDWLVDNLKHANVCKSRIGVDEVRHPAQEFKCTIELVVDVEARSGSVLRILAESWPG
jgi:hypothetical protein